MLDSEKPRRPPGEEQAEIAEVLKGPVERNGVVALLALQPSLAEEVAQRTADEDARLDARDREETTEERESDRRLRREESEIQAEIPFLQARERRRQATSPIDRAGPRWHGRQAS
jgi:hypothetical protein